MIFTRFFLFLRFIPFFVPLICCSAETQWIPEKVPLQDMDEFLFYYQHLLHADPFHIERKPKNEEEKLKNVVNHQQASILYNKLSEVAATLLQTAGLPDTAPENIKKDRTNHLRGTWNLYKNIPVNSADLWAESCFLKYQSLAHEADLDSEKIKTLHEFTTEIEHYAVLAPLFQHLKRDACLRSLSLIRRPMKDREENPKQKMPDISEADENLVSANMLFTDFLQKYPNEDNMQTAELFLDTVNRFRSEFPDSNRLSDAVELLRTVFVNVQKQISDPVIKEYAEIYEGTLRRQELIGKPMPVWGADLTGNILDEKSLAGKVVLLDFWATWCGPCIGEFPHLKQLYEKYHRNGFEIIGYNVDSDLKKLTAYLERNPLSWKILSKETTKRAELPSLSGYYGAKQLPVVLLRDQTGNAVLLDARGEKLDEMLEKIFGK
jgi:thiol-disulfide isomerase/thioredoxin